MRNKKQLPYRRFTLFSIMAVLILISCQSTDHSNQQGENDVASIQNAAMKENIVQKTMPRDSSKFYFDYDLTSAIAEHKLSKKLTEISGLSLSSDGQYLLAVNDELGTVFFLDKNSGNIVQEKKFGKKGDYEGLTMVGDQIYALRSDGTIYEISNLNSDELETNIYETTLDKKHDVEGLAYDPSNHRLLLACKKNSFEGESTKDLKAIYVFDLDTKLLSETPVYLISRKEVVFGKEARMESWWPNALSKSFGPSGLTIDPKTGNIYLLSSPGKLLLVLNPSGEVIHIQKLDKKAFRKPEGICFGKDGTLFISSEGNAKKRVKGEVLAFQPI